MSAFHVPRIPDRQTLPDRLQTLADLRELIADRQLRQTYMLGNYVLTCAAFHNSATLLRNCAKNYSYIFFN